MEGSEIRDKRKSLKLTQGKLADRLGVSKRTIINYENGAVIPESKVLLLDLVLNVNENYINEVKNDYDELIKNINKIINELKYENLSLENLEELQKAYEIRSKVYRDLEFFKRDCCENVVKEL